MKENWVDFKAVKSTVSFENLLTHYKIDGLQKNGDELSGRCPIHQGEGQRAFRVNLKKNVFNCFSCKARGNVLDFVSAMEKCSLRDAAIKLQTWFGVVASEEGTQCEKKTEEAPTIESESQIEEATAGNQALTFQLKGIDHAHPYLAGRGISTETAKEFGIGYFGGKGSMSGRVVIPIHSERGELVAYAGRAVDASEPKYKLPSGFHKSLELYNLHRAVLEQSDTVVIVEGFFDCVRVSEAGFSAVALMGCSMSNRQEELIAKTFGFAWVLMDGDESGKLAASEIAARLSRRIFVRTIELPVGVQPDSMSVEDVTSLLK